MRLCTIGLWLVRRARTLGCLAVYFVFGFVLLSQKVVISFCSAQDRSPGLLPRFCCRGYADTGSLVTLVKAGRRVRCREPSCPVGLVQLLCLRLDYCLGHLC